MCEAEGRSARQGMSARGVLGEVCARGGLQGRSVREVCQGVPGEVCQGRAAGEVWEARGGQGRSARGGLPGQAREAGRGGLPGL